MKISVKALVLLLGENGEIEIREVYNRFHFRICDEKFSIVIRDIGFEFKYGGKNYVFQEGVIKECSSSKNQNKTIDMYVIHFQIEEGGKVYNTEFRYIPTDEEVREYFEEKSGLQYSGGVYKWWRPGGDVETGFCDICGRGKSLQRKYYRYSIPCDCCNNKKDNHFEIVRYCAQCTPVPPRKLTVIMKPIDD